MRAILKLVLVMINRRTLLKTSLLLPFASQYLAQTARADLNELSNASWLEEIAEQLREEFGLPAVWLAVDWEDAVESAVVGVRKIGEPALATLQERLAMASISKTMAGLWIATLVDAGQLSYQTKVLDVLPELKPDCLPEHRDITLGQLLTHTAEVARDVRISSDVLPLDSYTAERLAQARLLLATPAPPESKGKRFYSNNGLTLAATMAERVAGEPYEIAAGRFYRERLELKSWGVWGMDTINQEMLAWPHQNKDKVSVAQPPRSVARSMVRPSGNAHCSIGDLARFGLIATDSTAISAALLTPQTWRALEVPALGGTTLASFETNADQTFYEHSGSLTFTSSYLRVFPRWKAAIAVYTNAAGDDFRVRAINVVQDAFRQRRAERYPPPPCRITLLEVATVDASWKNIVVPKANDDKIRIRVRCRVEARDEAREVSGDAKVLVKMGDAERWDNRYEGLSDGEHTLRFGFDVPTKKEVLTTVDIDALGTAGNLTPEAGRFESVLTLQ